MNKKKTQKPSASAAKPQKVIASAQIEASFRAVFENSRDAIGVSKAGIHLFVNPAYLALFGFPPAADLSGSPVLDIIATDRRNQIQKYVLCSAQGKPIPTTYETRGLRADGPEFDMEVKVSTYQENGEDNTLVILRDITERKEMEKELRARETIFHNLFNNTEVAMFRTRLDGSEVLNANDKFLELIGRTRDEVIGKPSVILWVDPRRREEMIRRLKVDGRVVDFEFQMINKNGQTRDCLTSLNYYPEEGILDGSIFDITERKRAMEALQLSEAKYRRLYNETPVLLHSIDRNGILVEVNDYWLKTLGYERHEVVGKKVINFLTAESQQFAREVVQPAFFRDGIAKDISYRFVKKTGEIIDVLLSATPEWDANGTVVRSQAVSEDVTERKRAEKVLRESENRTRSIIESLPIGMYLYLLEPDGRLVFTGSNPAADRILCVDNSIFIGKTIEEAFPALMATEVPQRYREVAATGKAWSTENLEYEEGSIKGAFDVHAFHTGPNAMAVAFKDVTERKQAEQALQENERRYRLLFESANDGIFIQDESDFIDCNRRGAEMYGLSKEKLLGRHPGELAPERQPDGRLSSQVASEKIQAAMSGVPQVFEWQPLRSDGTPFDVEITLSRLELGGKTCLQAIVRDISQRKQAEVALRENQTRLDLALQSAHMGIWRWEIIENRRYFDDLTCKLLGIEATKFTGSAEEFYAAVHPEDREKIKEALALTIQQDLPYEPEYRVVWPDGTIRYITSRARLVRDEQARPVRINGILWDITEQRFIDEERLKAQKIESIGTLAGGIAHDFNNLLQGIFGYISMAKMTYDQKEKSLSMLNQAEEALHLAVNLTSQLLTFSKGGKPIKKLIRLRPVIEKAVKLALSGSHTDYQLDAVDDLWPVMADEGQLAQVIQNIALNANEAMAGRGTVGIVLRNVEIGGNEHPSLATGGQFVCIEILDSGTGISEQNLKKIFDPYFTTKQRGSGLGLATSYAIIRNHDGVIEVRSERDKGTKFTIYLPAAAGAEPTETGSKTEGITAKKGRILLMDDEPLVRNVASEMIRALGHEVESAEEGKTALDMFIRAREAGHPHDVVVLDLTVKGGMGGQETIRQMREIDPGVIAVVSSGYSDNAVTAKYREHGFSAFLNKPYKLDALQDCLSALIK